MEGVDNFNVCWCCQMAQAGAGCWASLSSDCQLPICKPCWFKMPVDRRFELGLKYQLQQLMEQSSSGLSFEEMYDDNPN